MIDNSSTQALNPQKLSTAINNYFGTPQNPKHIYNNINFSYDTFNVKVDDGPPPQLRQMNLSISGKNWTNINAAFDRLRTTTADMKVFVSDGIPTVLDTTLNGRAIQCAYKHDPTGSGDINSTKLIGCEPKVGKREPDLNVSQCNGRYNAGGQGKRIQDVCANPYPVTSSNATHTVMAPVAGGETPIKTTVEAAGGRYYNTPEEFITALPTLFDALCPAGGSGLLGGQPRTFMSTFTVQNRSTNKSVQSVTVKTCNQAGGNCQSFLNTVGIQPQSTGRFSQVIPDSVPAASRALITCDVQYSDGSSLPCPKKQTQNESIQFNLTVDNRNVSGSTKTFLQAADVNNDGVVNGIDYVLCQKQIATTGKKTCDIVSDDLVNAQDISVVAERLGQVAK